MTENETENNIDIQKLHEKYKEYSNIKKEKRTAGDKVTELFATILGSILVSYGFYIFVAIAGGIAWYLGVDFDLIGISMIAFFVVSWIVSSYLARAIDKRKDKTIANCDKEVE